MAKRNRFKTVKTDVNHNDGYLTYSIPTMGESAENQSEIQTIVEKFGKASKESEEAVYKQFSRYVIDWNWIDDDGNPFPLPKNDPMVFSKLTGDEFTFIANVIKGKGVEEENRKK